MLHLKLEGTTTFWGVSSQRQKGDASQDVKSVEWFLIFGFSNVFYQRMGWTFNKSLLISLFFFCNAFFSKFNLVFLEQHSVRNTVCWHISQASVLYCIREKQSCMKPLMLQRELHYIWEMTSDITWACLDWNCKKKNKSVKIERSEASAVCSSSLL